MRALLIRIAVGLLFLLAWIGLPSVARAEQSSNSASVAGSLLKSDGKPAANVSVRICMAFRRKGAVHVRAAARDALKDAPDAKSDTADDEAASGEHGAWSETTTDAAGHFAFANLPSGNHVVLANAKSDGRAQKAVFLKEGQSLTLTLSLEPPAKDGAKDGARDGVAGGR